MWLVVIGVTVAAVVGFVLMLVFLGWAWHTFGFLGATIFIILLLIVLAALSDRREKKRYEDEELEPQAYERSTAPRDEIVRDVDRRI
jgi:membrane protein implicated in regulation of membrane protease activity